MSRSALGPKKRRAIERITGRAVKWATVRGGTEHFWALVVFADDRERCWYVNYKTGEAEPTDLCRPDPKHFL